MCAHEVEDQCRAGEGQADRLSEAFRRTGDQLRSTEPWCHQARRQLTERAEPWPGRHPGGETGDVAAEIESKIKTKLGIGVPRGAAEAPGDELAARRPA